MMDGAVLEMLIVKLELPKMGVRAYRRLAQATRAV